MFVSRRHGPASPHLEWRIRLFGVGAILGVAGIVASLRWMIWLALAVLLVGVLLRFLPAVRSEASGGDPKEDDDNRS
jgi:hypothetical protein